MNKEYQRTEQNPEGAGQGTAVPQTRGTKFARFRRPSCEQPRHYFSTYSSVCTRSSHSPTGIPSTSTTVQLRMLPKLWRTCLFCVQLRHYTYRWLFHIYLHGFLRAKCQSGYSWQMMWVNLSIRFDVKFSPTKTGQFWILIVIHKIKTQTDFGDSECTGAYVLVNTLEHGASIPQRIYMGWSDDTESMVTIRSPFCG